MLEPKQKRARWLHGLPALRLFVDLALSLSTLLFAEGQILGRAACQRMKVLSAACKGVGFIRIKDDLGETLLFLRDRVVLWSPRVLKATDRVCVHLYIDASYEEGNAGVGDILYSSHGLMLRWFSETASQSCLDDVKQPEQKGFIYKLEACASVLGVRCADPCVIVTSLSFATMRQRWPR